MEVKSFWNVARLAAIVVAVGATIIALSYAARGGALQGPVVQTFADVTCPGGAATLALPASTPAASNGAGVSNRMCVEIDWVSGGAIRFGDANISASQGIPIPAATGASKTFCGDGPIYCWGISTNGVAAFNVTNRQ